MVKHFKGLKMETFSMEVKCGNCGAFQKIEIPKGMRWIDFEKFAGDKNPLNVLATAHYLSDKVQNEDEQVSIAKEIAKPILSGYKPFDALCSDVQIVCCQNCKVPALKSSKESFNNFLPPELMERVVEMFDLYIQQGKKKMEKNNDK